MTARAKAPRAVRTTTEGGPDRVGRIAEESPEWRGQHAGDAERVHETEYPGQHAGQVDTEQADPFRGSRSRPEGEQGRMAVLSGTAIARASRAAVSAIRTKRYLVIRIGPQIRKAVRETWRRTERMADAAVDQAAGGPDQQGQGEVTIRLISGSLSLQTRISRRVGDLRCAAR